MARRKTWPEGVAERRGRKAWLKSVAGRRGRKAWLKGVVLRRACRIEDEESAGSLWFAARPFGVRMNVARACTNTVTYNAVLSEFSWLTVAAWALARPVISSISTPGALRLTTGRLRPGPEEIGNWAWTLPKVGSPSVCLHQRLSHLNPQYMTNFSWPLAKVMPCGLCWWMSYASL